MADQNLAPNKCCAHTSAVVQPQATGHRSPTETFRTGAGISVDEVLNGACLKAYYNSGLRVMRPLRSCFILHSLCFRRQTAKLPNCKASKLRINCCRRPTEPDSSWCQQDREGAVEHTTTAVVCVNGVTKITDRAHKVYGSNLNSALELVTLLHTWFAALVLLGFSATRRHDTH